jgi:hypothetical protein
MKVYDVTINGEKYESEGSCREAAIKRAFKDLFKKYNRSLPKDRIAEELKFEVYIERVD